MLCGPDIWLVYISADAAKKIQNRANVPHTQWLSQNTITFIQDACTMYIVYALKRDALTSKDARCRMDHPCNALKIKVNNTSQFYAKGSPDNSSHKSKQILCAFPSLQLLGAIRKNTSQKGSKLHSNEVTMDMEKEKCIIKLNWSSDWIEAVGGGCCCCWCCCF